MPRRHLSAFSRLLGALLLLVASLPLASAATATETENISAKGLTSHSCDDSEWHFVITGLDDAESAPASINVSWDTGASATVALEGVSGGTAHYRTTANLDATVTAATASIYSGWSGEFNLSHGPCGSAEGDDDDDSDGAGSTGGITAAVPTVKESCKDNGAVVTITATAHVTYSLNGSVVAAGDHVVTADSSGDYSAKVKAEADAGFTLAGKSSWDMSGTLDCGTAGGGGDNASGTVFAQALTNHECNDSEWHFVITGLESEEQAPASITVTFIGGVTEVVELEGVTGGTAHYRTTEHLDLAVTSASASITGEWSGQFNLSHGPCEDTAGEQPSTVAAVAPSLDENCDANKVTVTIPSTAHVTYKLNGSVVAAGAHDVAADNEGDFVVVVTAHAESGWTLSGQSEWNLSGTLDCEAAGGGGGSTTVLAKALTDHECNDSEWHFVITGLESEAQAPASITVTFTGGVTLVVDLEKVTGGTAHYRTTAHLDLAVTSASATITGDWSGQFNLSHGPCGDTAGEQPNDVTAVAPTVVYDCTTNAVVVTIPATPHVSYKINGVAAAAGTHSVSADAEGKFSVIVTATAEAGFTLKGEATFTFVGTLKCDTPPTPTPGNPAVSVSQQPCTAGGTTDVLVHIAVAAGSTTAPYTVTKSVGGAAATVVSTVNLPNGATTTADVGVSLVEDTAVRIVVSSGATTLADVTLIANCVAPGGVTPTTPPTGGGTGGTGGTTGGGSGVAAGGASTGGAVSGGTQEDTGVLGTKTGQTPTSSGGSGVLAATGAALPVPALVGLGALLLLAGLVLLGAPRLLSHGKHRAR